MKKTKQNKSFLERLNAHFERIDGELEKSYRSPIPLIEEICQHSILGEGKRMRPLLFILSSRMCGYERPDAYRISTIFEYIHTASLLHDDVLDNADLRRKKPSAKSLWGNLAAVLGGDYLYAKANSLMVECDNSELYRVLNNTTTKMLEGQFLELIHTHNWSIRKEEYIEIIRLKTAVLMSASCESGGLIAGVAPEARESLSRFGMDLGIAFQLIDDLLDYTTTEKNFGKPVGKDLKEGKITLPLIYTLASFDRPEIDRLEERFKNNDVQKEDFEEIIGRVRENGAIERIHDEVKDYSIKAVRCLEQFPDSPYKKDLKELSTFLAERTY